MRYLLVSWSSKKLAAHESAARAPLSCLPASSDKIEAENGLVRGSCSLQEKMQIVRDARAQDRPQRGYFFS
jgi:hypothetical protein